MKKEKILKEQQKRLKNIKKERQNSLIKNPKWTKAILPYSPLLVSTLSSIALSTICTFQVTPNKERIFEKVTEIDSINTKSSLFYQSSWYPSPENKYYFRIRNNMQDKIWIELGIEEMGEIHIERRFLIDQLEQNLNEISTKHQNDIILVVGTIMSLGALGTITFDHEKLEERKRKRVKDER